MKRGNKKFIVMILIVIGVLITSVTFFLFSRTSKEIRRFEEAFDLTLPKETNVIFSEDTHGALGDGVRLYIYQISSKDMAEFVKQSRSKNWYRLPFDDILSKGLSKMINGVSSEEIASAMKLGCQKGYYLVKNRYNMPLNSYNFQHYSYNNIIIGIIDLEKNRIYYYTLDM